MVKGFTDGFKCDVGVGAPAVTDATAGLHRLPGVQLRSQRNWTQ